MKCKQCNAVIDSDEGFHYELEDIEDGFFCSEECCDKYEQGHPLTEAGSE